MGKYLAGVSIVIPTIRNIEESSIVKSFIDSSGFSRHVQFVFLSNSRDGVNANPTFFKGTSHDILIISNDRYFGSCEENIRRASDFSDTFHDYVLLVGEHDEISWSKLGQVLDRVSDQDLDVLGWNVDSQQLTSIGTKSSLSAIHPFSIDSFANDQCRLLFDNEVVDSSLAFPALISLYGPVDWAAYLGNHLIKKWVFQRLFQYKFSESVYSFVYRQFKFFSDNNLRYGFNQQPAISRISDDFLRMRENRYSPGWLEEHRTVCGLSPCFSLSNLQCLVELDDVHSFNLIANALCFAQVPSATDESIQYHHGSFLSKSLAWSRQALIHRLEGRSYYIPDLAPSGGFGDLGTVHRFLCVLQAQVSCSPIYEFFDSVFLELLSRVVCELGGYLSGSLGSESSLTRCVEVLKRCEALLDSTAVVRANQRSFSEFALGRR